MVVENVCGRVAGFDIKNRGYSGYFLMYTVGQKLGYTVRKN